MTQRHTVIFVLPCGFENIKLHVDALCFPVVLYIQIQLRNIKNMKIKKNIGKQKKGGN